MKESLWVQNPTKFAISLNLHPKHDEDALIGLSKHKAKRVTKAGFINIRVDSNQKIDLVKATGLTLEDIKACKDYHLYMRKGLISVVSETHVVEVIDEVIDTSEPELSKESILVEDKNTNKETPLKPKKGVSLFKKAKKE